MLIILNINIELKCSLLDSSLFYVSCLDKKNLNFSVRLCKQEKEGGVEKTSVKYILLAEILPISNLQECVGIDFFFK